MEERKVEGAWLKVFCPDARCLSDEEIMDLPKEKRDHPQVAGKQGLWLEIFCPDQSCLSEQEKVSVPMIEADPEGKGSWLKLFCPDDRCVIDEASGLP